jgi:hypothetical protein
VPDLRVSEAVSTPGRRRALKALAAAKNTNLHRVAKGEKPVVAGKTVAPSTIGLSKGKAQRILKSR